MSPSDIEKAKDLFSTVGKTSAYEMRKKCIDAVRKLKAKMKSDLTKKYLSQLEQEMISFELE